MRDNSTSLSLLEQVRRREQQAWDRLLYLYSPLVDHWLRHWSVPEADIDDLRQEVFQSVATGLETFRRDRPGDTFRGWLRVIAKRKFLDHCRRQQRQPSATGGSDAQLRMLQIPHPDESEEDDAPSEVTRLYHRALELIRTEFEDRTWRAFWRCAVENHSPLDVGRDMAMTAAAVRKAKSRVLHRLKLELGDLLY